MPPLVPCVDLIPSLSISPTFRQHMARVKHHTASCNYNAGRLQKHSEDAPFVLETMSRLVSAAKQDKDLDWVRVFLYTKLIAQVASLIEKEDPLRQQFIKYWPAQDVLAFTYIFIRSSIQIMSMKSVCYTSYLSNSQNIKPRILPTSVVLFSAYYLQKLSQTVYEAVYCFTLHPENELRYSKASLYHLNFAAPVRHSGRSELCIQWRSCSTLSLLTSSRLRFCPP